MIECIITLYANNKHGGPAHEKRFEEAFDFIKHVFKVKKLYDDQMRLMKASCNIRSCLRVHKFIKFT